MRRSSDIKSSKESTVVTRAMQSQQNLLGQDAITSSQVEVGRRPFDSASYVHQEYTHPLKMSASCI